MLLRFELATAAALLLAPGATSFSAIFPSGSLAASRPLPRACGQSLRASAAPQESAPPTVTREEAKAKLRDARVRSGGSTLAEDVVAACEVLAGFNPTSSPARAWPLHSGVWKSIGEDFVGTTRTADGLECTLGRLAFNIFEPVKLPVLITGVDQTIGEVADNADPATRYLCWLIRWEARDGSGLRGLCLLEGRCWEHPSNPDRVQLNFSKGTLQPDEGQDLEAWRKVVGVKDAKDAEKKGSLGRLKEGATKLVLKVAFGFKGPADTQGPQGELFYEMARSPKGYIDILYLDEEMRVTKGQKGAIVVVSRL